MAKTKANKQVICEVLMEAAAAGDRDVVVVCSDSRGSASMTPFFDTYPEQAVEAGIAEQDAVSMAAGMAALLTAACPPTKKLWKSASAALRLTASGCCAMGCPLSCGE